MSQKHPVSVQVVSGVRRSGRTGRRRLPPDMSRRWCGQAQRPLVSPGQRSGAFGDDRSRRSITGAVPIGAMFTPCQTISISTLWAAHGQAEGTVNGPCSCTTAAIVGSPSGQGLNPAWNRPLDPEGGTRTPRDHLPGFPGTARDPSMRMYRPGRLTAHLMPSHGVAIDGAFSSLADPRSRRATWVGAFGGGGEAVCVLTAGWVPCGGQGSARGR